MFCNTVSLSETRENLKLFETVFPRAFNKKVITKKNRFPEGIIHLRLKLGTLKKPCIQKKRRIWEMYTNEPQRHESVIIVDVENRDLQKERENKVVHFQ